MEPLLPKKFITRQQSKLLYAVNNLKKLSEIDNNNNNNNSAYYDMLCKNLINGDIHDTYRIYHNKLLGKGTYGSVYLATHRKNIKY